MRRRIVSGLALAVLPIAAGTATMPSWPRVPLLAAPAPGGRVAAAHRQAAAFAAGDRASSARARVRLMPGRPHRAAGGGGRALVATALRPTSLGLLGDLGKRLSDLTSRMAHVARGIPLSQRSVERLLIGNHVHWRSNGHCHDRANPSCTAFEGLRRGSLDDLFAFGRTSRCPLTVSGGTEQGHAPGRLSHGTGHKIDVMPTGCLDAFIPDHYRHIGQRGDLAEQYRSPDGDVFAREVSHWDILVPR